MGKKRKIKRIIVRLIAFALMLAMLCLTACGRTGKNGSGEGDETLNKGNADNEDEGHGELADSGKVMGRYLEQAEDSLKGELNVGSKIIQMEDGSLVIISKTGKWVSEDNGVTWEREELEWYEELNASNWLMDIAVSKDGYAAVIYAPKEENTDGEDAEASGTEGEAASNAGEEGEGNSDGESETESKAESAEGDGAKKEEDDGEEGIDMQRMDFSIHPRYRLIAPDSSFIEIEISYKDNDYVNYFTFSDDGRLFGTALGGKVYEIDRETGSSEELMELPHWAPYAAAKDGKLMLVDGNSITIVDLSTGETVEDEVLNDFLKEQGSILEYTTTGVQPLLLLTGEDGILYLAFEKGIYRHVIGGNVIEQVVDGTLTSLGNPSYRMSDGVLLENDVFLLLFSSGELMRYTYDPDMPAVPQIQLNAYSLMENEQLKRVISSYQAKHPEIYIRYETGMDGASAVTREDALKKLNTEIAAGKGPDIFILDDMPIDSYIEKGVLLDLTLYLEDKAGDKYFTNILHAFRTSEGTYAVPAQFQAALMVGKQGDIEKMTDLEAIAEMMESYREDKAEGMIFGARGEEEMLDRLLPVCAPAWKDGNGKIDKAALTDFYTLIKRMWDVENAGLDDETKKEYADWLEDRQVSVAADMELRDYQFSIGGRMLEYLAGDQEFVFGVISDSFDFDTMISCFKIKGKTDSGFTPYSGQAKGVFVPNSLMGINRTSAYQDIAVELLAGMLDDEGWRGISVNKENCRERFRINATEDGSSYGSMAVMPSGGGYIGLDIYPASEEEIGLLMKAVEEGSTPYVRDPVLEDAVCEAGIKVMRGEMDAAAGVEEVVRKTAIYMSE